MNIKRSIAFLMVLILSLGMLVGCGGSDDGEAGGIKEELIRGKNFRIDGNCRSSTKVC